MEAWPPCSRMIGVTALNLKRRGRLPDPLAAGQDSNQGALLQNQQHVGVAVVKPARGGEVVGEVVAGEDFKPGDFAQQAAQLGGIVSAELPARLL